MNKILEFFRNVNQEIKKVTWPNKNEIVDSTMVVFVSLIFLSTIVGVIDLCFSKLITFVF